MQPMMFYNIKDFFMIRTSWPLHSGTITKLLSEILFLPEWYQKGICSISDILDDTGEVVSLLHLQNKYEIKDNNFLNHLRVNVGTLKFLKTKKYNKISVDRPYIMNHVKIFFHHRTSASTFYKYVNTERQNLHSMKEKWNKDLDTTINNETWKIIFSNINNIYDNNLLWFQIKVVYRILGTKAYCNKIGILPHQMCSFCQNHTETLVHLFAQCVSSQEIWKGLERHI